jgi:hypothetical protein
MKLLLVLLLAGCASGPSTKVPEVRPIDEDQLALLPAGADIVIDVDMEQLRTWTPARRLFALLPADARAELGAMGIDPWLDLDGLVLALSGVGGGEPATTLLMRGDLDAAKIAHALGGESSDYRRAQLTENGARAVARLSPRMVAFGAPAQVRKVIDLVNGLGESVRSADRALVTAFARAPSAKSGRPAVIAAAVPSDAMRERLRADSLPGGQFDWLSFVLAVGDGFDFEIIGKAKSLGEAASLATEAKASLEQLRARPVARFLGIAPYLEDIVVVARQEEVRMVYRLPGQRLRQMLGRLEQILTSPRR